jgi:hypothetical protein
MTAHTTGGLRKVMDGDDNFVKGHQIVKIKRYRKKIPDVLKTDIEIQKLILRSFPLLKTNSLQRWRAGRWARVIHLYFVSGYNYKETADAMNEDYRTVEMLIRAIRRASEDKPCDGRKTCRKKNTA